MKNNTINAIKLADWYTLSTVVKVMIILGCCLIIIYLGYLFDLQPIDKRLTQVNFSINKMRSELANKAVEVNKLTDYQKNIIQLQKQLADQAKQLSASNEMTTLLEELNNIGLNNGLLIQLIKPLPSINQHFLLELPLQISVIGSYHQIGLFLSQIAKLNQTVTLQDYSLEPFQNKQAEAMQNAEVSKELLVLTATANMYQFVEVPKQSLGA